MSIYLNFDLTFFDDNSNLYGLFANYFDDKGISSGKSIDLRKILKIMESRSEGDIEELKEDAVKLI